MKGGWTWLLAGQSKHEDAQESPKALTQNVWVPSHSSGDVEHLLGDEAGLLEVEI